ncbi:Zinc finger protein, partial [Plakobranchus ocellatus]
VDSHVTRYCRSCFVCKRTTKRGFVPRVSLEKVTLVDAPFERLAIDIVGPINPPAEVGRRFIRTLVTVPLGMQRQFPCGILMLRLWLRRWWTSTAEQGLLADTCPSDDIAKTAFVTVDRRYEFLRMPFGMMNSGAIGTRAMKILVRGMDYVNDLLIHTPIWEDHVMTLREFFRRLQRVNFTARRTKCVNGARTIDFLGHRLGKGAVGLQDENIDKVRAAPRPKIKEEARAFLGLVDHYKEFIPNYAAISAFYVIWCVKVKPGNLM